MHPRRLKVHPTICTLALLLSAAAASAQKPPQARPVQIENGKLLGVLTPDQKVIAYKGIPYAAPPVGDLRWRPPQPVGRWKHILFARNFGYHCIQSGSYPDMVFHDPGPSEDCLTLNVWAPVASTARPAPKHPAPLPVMVWIYGGGFTTGGTSENRQDGGVPRPSRSHRRLHELPPGRLRLHGPAGADRRECQQRLRQLRPDGPDRGHRLGAAQHRGLRRRSQPTSQSSANRPDRSRSARRSPRPSPKASSVKPSARAARSSPASA